jgi:hypothetical protein
MHKKLLQEKLSIKEVPKLGRKCKGKVERREKESPG